MSSKILFDRFRLLSKLGEGSFGKIYKGIDTISNKLVAIKVETVKGHQLKIEAKKLGANGTPTFFIMGPDGQQQKLVGAQPYSVFKQVLDSII